MKTARINKEQGGRRWIISIESSKLCRETLERIIKMHHANKDVDVIDIQLNFCRKMIAQTVHALLYIPRGNKIVKEFVDDIANDVAKVVEKHKGEKDE